MNAETVLHRILERADVIGPGPDRTTFLLIQADREFFDLLCDHGAASEGMEPGTDDEPEPLDDDDEAEAEDAA